QIEEDGEVVVNAGASTVYQWRRVWRVVVRSAARVRVAAKAVAARVMAWGGVAWSRRARHAGGGAMGVGGSGVRVVASRIRAVWSVTAVPLGVFGWGGCRGISPISCSPWFARMRMDDGEHVVDVGR